METLTTTKITFVAKKLSNNCNLIGLLVWYNFNDEFEISYNLIMWVKRSHSTWNWVIISLCILFSLRSFQYFIQLLESMMIESEYSLKKGTKLNNDLKPTEIGNEQHPF